MIRTKVYSHIRDSDAIRRTSRHRSLLFHMHTAFLFTKSDFKTMMGPQAVFGCATALAQLGPSAKAAVVVAARVPQMLIWLWLNLLVFNLANQRREDSVVEDAINRPWRPIPSGRLTPAHAKVALNLVAPAVLLLSATVLGHRSVLPNVVVFFLAWLYNDVGAANASPVYRNLVNALGIASFGWGATASLLSGGHGFDEVPIPYDWLALTAAVTFTTVQSQDLPDMKGDAARNRMTMPLKYGETVTRWCIAIFALFWSLVSPAYWHITNPVVYCVPFAVGTTMAVLVTRFRNEASDKVVWTCWCIWVALIYLLPLLRG